MHLNSGLCTVPWPGDGQQNEGHFLNVEGLRYLHPSATEIKSQVYSFLKAELGLGTHAFWGLSIELIKL